MCKIRTSHKNCEEKKIHNNCKGHYVTLSYGREVSVVIIDPGFFFFFKNFFTIDIIFYSRLMLMILITTLDVELLLLKT